MALVAVTSVAPSIQMPASDGPLTAGRQGRIFTI